MGSAVIAKQDRVKLFVAPADATEITMEHKIGSATSIGDITSTDEEIDTTTLESEAREFETGFTDNGSLEITQNLTADEYTKMKGYKDTGEELQIGISIHDKKQVPILELGCNSARVMSVTLGGMTVGGLVTVVTSIRLSGALDTDFVGPEEDPED